MQSTNSNQIINIKKLTVNTDEVPNVLASAVKVNTGTVVTTGIEIPHIDEIIGSVCTHDHWNVKPADRPVTPINEENW